MAYQTRSQGSHASTESVDQLSQVELEIINKKLVDKEKLIQEQANALKTRQLELDKREADLNKERNAAVGIEGLSTVLNTLRQELTSLKNLPTQLEQLTQRVNEISSSPKNPDISALNAVNLSTPRQNELYANRDSPVQPTYLPPDSTSPIRFKDVVESVPRWDGHKPSIFQFCKICERAAKLVPPQQEKYLVQLVTNKFQGHAYTAVEGMNFSTIASLTQHLKKIFGPNKSLNQYRGELGNMYMLPNEDIFSYVDRAKELRSAIIDGEANLYGTLMPQDDDRIDQDVLESFINGLPADLLVRVKLEGQYSNLDGAIASAIQLSKTLEAESRRKKHVPTVRVNPTPRVDFISRNSNPPENKQSELPPRSNSSNVPFIKPLIPGQLGPNAPSPKICRYCKNTGHLMHECRKLAYRQAMLNTASTSGTQSGNATSVPENRGVHRDANQTGRQIDPKTVRFQMAPLSTTASPT